MEDNLSFDKRDRNVRKRKKVLLFVGFFVQKSVSPSMTHRYKKNLTFLAENVKFPIEIRETVHYNM